LRFSKFFDLLAGIRDSWISQGKSQTNTSRWILKNKINHEEQEDHEEIQKAKGYLLSCFSRFK